MDELVAVDDAFAPDGVEIGEGLFRDSLRVDGHLISLDTFRADGPTDASSPAAPQMQHRLWFMPVLVYPQARQ